VTQPQETWADPSPAGLFAVGAGTTAVWTVLTGRAGPHDGTIFVVWLLASGLLQLVVGLVHLRRGDPTGGSLNLAFGVLFFGAPAGTAAVLSGGAVAGGGGATLVMNGWVFLLLGIVLAAYVPVAARQSALLVLALAVFVAAVFLLALLNLRSPVEQQQAPWPLVAWSAGWLIGGAGLLMVYLGIATAWLHAFGRSVLPVPGPLVGAAGPAPAAATRDPRAS
jgi:hypothetical protein